MKNISQLTWNSQKICSMVLITKIARLNEWNWHRIMTGGVLWYTQYSPIGFWCLKMSWQGEHGKIKCKTHEIINRQWRQFWAYAYFGGLRLYSIQSVMFYFVHYTFSAVEPNVYKNRRQTEGGNNIQLSVFYWIIKTLHILITVSVNKSIYIIS
jgi:hypothetical protein